MLINRLYKEPWPRIIGIPLVSLILILIDGKAISWGHYAVTFSFTFIFWNVDYYIICKLRNLIPDLKETPKRIMFTIITVSAFNVTADFFLCSTYGSIGLPGFGNYLGIHLSENLLKNLITTLIVGTLYETGYFFKHWKEKSLELEQIKSQQLKSELSVLKNQISPHFLFNSLNTLVALIHENPIQAARFTEKLSQVYRYILKYKEKEIVKLPVEIDFVSAYNYLMKIRFEKSLILNVNIPLEYHTYYIAPLTIQMLIENAVKHNIVSSSKPLIVDIYIENGESLIVRNNIQRKLSDVNSMKMGLDNIKQRYILLSNREVKIDESYDYFTVTLPLIEVSTGAELLESI